MAHKLIIVLLVVGLYLMGITPVLAQKVYPSLTEYEKLTGKSIEKFDEAPSLRIRVAAGEIPPVEKRLPEEPLVLEPLKEIGQYGGELRTAATGPAWGGGDDFTARAQYLVKFLPDLKTIVPNIAKGWDFSKDIKTLTIYLRKGMKWSDGALFTADDFLFWYEDILLNDEITPIKPRRWSPGGELVKVEKIDDYTVRFQFAIPYPPVIELLTDIEDPYAPKHYLKRYHIKYNPEADEIAKKEGYEKWWMCFNLHNLWNHGQGQQDTNRPTVDSRILTKIDTIGNKYFERNPYYWKVDPNGNQLPYIGKQVRILVENTEIMGLKAIAGELDAVGQHLNLKDYSLYKKSEKKGDYHVMLWKKPWGSALGFAFNYSHEDSILRKIFSDIRFRQGMSLAINRKEINDTLFFGKAAPAQATIIPTTSFYEPWMGKYYAEYDPARANKLLDEMGLKWDRKHEYRLRSDGKTLAMTIEFVKAEGPVQKICELVRDYWRKVGINIAIKEDERTLFIERALGNKLDIGHWGLDGFTEHVMYAEGKGIYPFYVTELGNYEWELWYLSKGEAGTEPWNEVKEILKLIEKWRATSRGTEEYVKLGKEIATRNVKNLFIIGTVGRLLQPIIMKDNLQNTPEKEATWCFDYKDWVPYHPDQWFFKR